MLNKLIVFLVQRSVVFIGLMNAVIIPSERQFTLDLGFRRVLWTLVAASKAIPLFTSSLKTFFAWENGLIIY